MCLDGLKGDMIMCGQVVFDAETGRIASVVDKSTNASIELSQDFLFYKGFAQ